jgi:hypothetical protein
MIQRDSALTAKIGGSNSTGIGTVFAGAESLFFIAVLQLSVNSRHKITTFGFFSVQ